MQENTKKTEKLVSLKSTSPEHAEKETFDPPMISASTEKESDPPKAIVASHFLNRHYKREKSHKPKIGTFQHEKRPKVKFGEKRAYD